MSEAKHTPGPWRVGRCGPNGCHTVGTQDGLMTAMVAHSVNYDNQREQAVGDAHLIAAAPEMLEALEFADRRSRQEGESQLSWFERLAEEFYHRHGYLAPGKDDPIRSVSDEERRAAWDAFLNEPAEKRRAAIAKAKGES